MENVFKVLLYLTMIVEISICEKNPVVTIKDGKVMGISNQTLENNTTYYTFRGIPFAKPPVGNLRFKPPQKPDSWSDTLNGTLDGPDCLQMNNKTVVGSEDCLFINVYTPDTSLSGSVAVMVWIYGGSFTQGTSSYKTYKPDYFLEQGVVYVSFNYRLGPLGWLSTEDGNCPGNFGMKDQILALKWVQENIANFGGDPENVTIFGESAGAASVSYLLQSNLTEGLFHKAIVGSGTTLNLWALTTNPRKNAFGLGTLLKIFALDSKTLIDQLRKTDAKDIVKASGNALFSLDVLAGLPWGPVIEPWSNGASFSGRSHDLLIEGKFRRVPIIIGYNSNEIAVLGVFQEYIKYLLIGYNLDYSKIAPYDLTTNRLKKLAAGIKIKDRYFGKNILLTTDPDKIIPFANFDQFIRGTREFANLTSLYTKVYFYRFNYVGKLSGNDYANWGVAHSDELTYLFVSDNNGTDHDNIVRKRMVTMWTNFAKYGEPKFVSDDTLLFPENETTEWKPARISRCTSPGTNCSLAATTDINYLNITPNLFMAKNPNETDYVFYRDEIFGRYGDGHYTTF